MVSSNSERLVSTLLHSAGLVHAQIEQALGGVGLSWAKYGVLEVLLNEEEPLPLSVLATRLQCVRSNMTQLVDRLEADGLVQRANSPTDRRIKQAELTALGKEKAKAGKKEIAAIESSLADSLGEDYERLLAVILPKLS